MSQNSIAHLHLEPELRKSAEAGEHNFIGKVVSLLEKSQFKVEFPKDAKAVEGVYSLTHMVAPPDERGLVFRRGYHYPFWQIDPMPKRWHWQVAGLSFDPNDVPAKEAKQFYQFWQKRLFDDAPQKTQQLGYIYAPLQGKLTRARAFQKCSPIEMLAHCLKHDLDRKIIATLHPKETYSRAEMSALSQLDRQNSRLTIETGNMVQHLCNCDYIVTQNSSAAFNGAFFGKAALLFAGADFHHFTVAANMDDLEGSFSKVAVHEPLYAAYLWWFWKKQSINAGREDAEAKIAAKLNSFGWPID